MKLEMKIAVFNRVHHYLYQPFNKTELQDLSIFPYIKSSFNGWLSDYAIPSPDGNYAYGLLTVISKEESETKKLYLHPLFSSDVRKIVPFDLVYDEEFYSVRTENLIRFEDANFDGIDTDLINSFLVIDFYDELNYAENVLGSYHWLSERIGKKVQEKYKNKAVISEHTWERSNANSFERQKFNASLTIANLKLEKLMREYYSDVQDEKIKAIDVIIQEKFSEKERNEEFSEDIIFYILNQEGGL